VVLVGSASDERRDLGQIIMFCFELFFCFNVPLSTKQMLLQQAQIFQGVTADPVEQAQIVPTPLRNAEGFKAGTINENQWLKQTLFLCTTLFQVKTSPYRLSKLPLNIPDPSPCPPCPRIQIPLQVSLSYLLRFLCVSFSFFFCSHTATHRRTGFREIMFSTLGRLRVSQRTLVLVGSAAPAIAYCRGMCVARQLFTFFPPWCHHPLPAFFYLTR